MTPKHAAPEAASLSADVFAAIDVAVMTVDPDDVLRIYLPTPANPSYNVHGSTMKLGAYLDDETLIVYTATRSGVLTGREVRITRPTADLVIAVVTSMLAEVTA